MPIELNTTGDFSTIFDGGEPLTLLRRGSSDTADIAVAWRYEQTTSEREPAGGYVPQTDVVWQFEWPAAALPRLGDRLRDAGGQWFTVMEVVRLQNNTRLRCISRNLTLAHGLDCLVDIELAVWDAGAITGWTAYRPAVHARIQPDETTVDETASPISSTATYRVTLADATLALDHNHRLVGADAAVYRVLSFTGSQRIDALPVAMVRREA